MKLRIAIPALILFVAMLACSLPTAGTPAPGGVDVVGTAVVGTAQAASLATAQALPSPTAFQPVANNTEVPLPTIIPTAQCTSVYSTYKVDIVDGNFVFGPWDSDLALAQWPGVGVGLAWAQWRGICKLDFVYDAQMQHAFVVVHKGEADEPAVKELYSTIGAKVLIWVYLSAQNTEVMCKSARTDLTFVRWQLYNNDGWEIPSQLACP